ncbi:site-specific integrase [Luteibaculum oceani]|uniref:Tyrosine-type recombinase/integrase n=1 Tax=Luteibaculum oceani TaxID=1294296 RepID=A0A5C6V2R0_9FLAO|nr:site-specific integrase [Luteibaculum oceani]TXC78766.1 tyrosine-type recombinase/integrase [Luteibaculum oceani]
MASVKILLRNKSLKSGKYPIILKLYARNGKTSVITTGINLNKSEWDANKLSVRRSVNNYKAINQALFERKQKIEELINTLEAENANYTLQDIKIGYQEIFHPNIEPHAISIFEFAKHREEYFREHSRHSSAKSCYETARSFKSYIKKSITFDDITPEILDGYELFLKKAGGTEGGISFKMREIRAWYNSAIEKGNAKKENYPFNTYKISKLKSDYTPTTLSPEEFEKFKNINLSNRPDLELTQLIFLFSFYSGGVNLKDLAFLTKKKNLKDGRVHFTRRKTKKKLSFPLNETLYDLLKRMDKFTEKDSPYLLPILNNQAKTDIQMEGRYKRQLKRHNKNLKIIGELIGIENKKITSYVARHAFSTTTRDKGVGIEKLGQILGHSDIKTTKGYFGQFSNEATDEVLNDLQ